MRIKTLIFSLVAITTFSVPAYSQDKAEDNNGKTYWLYLYKNERRLDLSAADSAFMKKYNVAYKGYYCTLLRQDTHYANAIYDNCYTFQELDKHYGKEWRTEVNKKAVALNEEDKYKKEVKKAIKDHKIYVPVKAVKVPDMKAPLWSGPCF